MLHIQTDMLHIQTDMLHVQTDMLHVQADMLHVQADKPGRSNETCWWFERITGLIDELACSVPRNGSRRCPKKSPGP
jgi:hypothetical protein